jgi:hypothetical protein
MGYKSITAVPDAKELKHTALLVFGVLLVSYISMEVLMLRPAGWSLGELLPTIGVYAIGLMFWDRLIHAII